MQFTLTIELGNVAGRDSLAAILREIADAHFAGTGPFVGPESQTLHSRNSNTVGSWQVRETPSEAVATIIHNHAQLLLSASTARPRQRGRTNPRKVVTRAPRGK